MPEPMLRDPEAAASSRRVAVAALALSFLYLLTHGGNLGRELTSEEGYFTIPGRWFFESGHYQGYFGENLHGGSNAHNPFHKPPGASLLLGAFSFLSPDGVTGARLAPLLAGWFAMLLPLLLTKRWVPSLLVLIAPFFYAGSSHMQTDPTVGLLGYGLVLIYWNTVWNGRPQLGWLVAGSIVAWTGKVEIGVMAAFASALASCLLWRPRGVPTAFRRVCRDLLVANVAGVGTFVLLTWALGCTAGYDFGSSVGFVIDTILRIGKILEVSGAANRPALYQIVANFHGWQLATLLAAPIALGIAALVRRGALQPPNRLARHATFLAFGVVPFAVYGIGGYVGDGYPRYFLIGYLALAVAAGSGLEALRARWPRFEVAGALLLLLVGLGTCLPKTLAMMHEPSAITVQRGTTGWRLAAQLVDARAPAGLWVVGPERCYWYARSRPWLFLDTFDPYPAMREKTYQHEDAIGGIILPKSTLSRPVEFSETTLLPRLLAKGTWDHFVIQDVAVWIRR